MILEQAIINVEGQQYHVDVRTDEWWGMPGTMVYVDNRPMQPFDDWFSHTVIRLDDILEDVRDVLDLQHTVRDTINIIYQEEN